MARRPKPDSAELEAQIGHSFQDADLLRRALTHVSAVNGEGARVETYQRLEFLGDRVLGLAVSEMLFVTFPEAHEGELSRRLADLVRRETCAEVATEWGAGAHIRLGAGEAQTGGRRKNAILADVCESLIGAVFLDGGFEVARDVVQRAWRQRMLTPRRPLRDSKTSLQEWAQARGLPTPVYREVGRSGPEHQPQFRVAVTIDGFDPADALGPSKRVAEQAAARAFMAREKLIETPAPEKAAEGADA
jgi:ribonuclease-3